MSAPWPTNPPSAHYSPEHVLWMNMVDNTAARLTYPLVLLALLGLTLLALRRPLGTSVLARRAGVAHEWLRRHGGWLVAVGVIVVTNSLSEWPRLVGPLAVLGAAAALARLSPRPALQAAIAALGLGSILLWHWQGLFHPLDFSADGPNLEMAEMHYNHVFGAGDRLASGMQLWTDVRPNYGLFWPGLFAAVQRLRGPMTMGQQVTVTYCVQLFACLAFASVAAWRYARDPLPVVLAMLLVTPWLSDRLALIFPNLSAMRCAGFFVAMGLMLGLRHRSAPTGATAVGAVVPFLLLLNPETGLAASAGLACFLWALHPLPLRAWLALALRGLAAAGVSGAALVVLFRLGVGQWPFAQAGTVAAPLTKFMAGYCGLALHFDVVPLTMFALCAWVAVDAALSRRRRAGSFAVGFQLAVAVTALIWGAYYVNRPSDVNVRSYYLLVGVLLLPALRRRALLSAGKRALTGSVPAGLVLYGLTLGAASFDLARSIDVVRAAQAAAPEVPRAWVQGVALAPADAQRLLLRSQALLREPKDSVYVFSVSAMFLPDLSGRQNGLPFGDTLLEVVTLEDFEKLVARVLEAPRPRVFFDSPEQGLSPAYRGVQQRVKERIARAYHAVETRDGWEIWERLPPSQ